MSNRSRINGKPTITSRTQLQLHERRELALALKKKGWNTNEIGRELGVTREAAYNLVRGAMEEAAKRMVADARELRAIDDARLEALYKAVAPRAERGELGAIDRAIKILERRARMFGYDLRPPDVTIDQSEMVIIQLPDWKPAEDVIEGHATEEPTSRSSLQAPPESSPG